MEEGDEPELDCEGDDLDIGVEVGLEEISRPTTPKWWRPSIPPETYLWEEMRRKRQQGGYPWTILDKDDFSDNLYEPVNPPPLYGSGYNVHKDPETTSLDERMIEIPPELDIVTSDGLDGLDLPDPHETGIRDGDREWRSFHPEHQEDCSLSRQSSGKATFTAGIRNKPHSSKPPRVGEGSIVRPLANKGISLSPEASSQDEAGATHATVHFQEVPEVDGEPMDTGTGAGAGTGTGTDEAGPSKPLSPLEQLKSQAGKMKQRLNKISLPVRPKFNQWTGAAVKLARRKGKGKGDKVDPRSGHPEGDDLDQQVPEQEEVGGWTEPLSLEPEAARPVRTLVSEPIASQSSNILPPASDPPVSHQQLSNQADGGAEKELQEKLKIEQKKQADEELKKLKAEEKIQREKEQEELKRLKAEEKLKKDQELEEKKRLQNEEKLRKDKEREEEKQQKLLEKQQKEKEKEALKQQKLDKKLQQEKLQQAISVAKQEEIQKAKEEQEQQAKDFAEEARQMLAGPGSGDVSPQIQNETQTQPPDFSQSLIHPRSPATEATPAPPTQYSDEEDEEPMEEQAPISKSKPGGKSMPSPLHFIQEKKRQIADMDFAKRFKRSKTPPLRPDPPASKPGLGLRSKFRFSRQPPPPPENQLASQYADEIKTRDEEAHEEKERLHEPQIFITQPSVESSSDAASYQGQGSSSRQGSFKDHHQRKDSRERTRPYQQVEYDRDQEEDEEDYMEDENDEERVPTPTKNEKENFGQKLKGFGVKSGQIAAQTSKSIGQKMKVLGHGIKEFGVNAVQEVKAKQEAVKQRDAEKKAAAAAALEEGGDDEYKPAVHTEGRTVFKFKKRDPAPEPRGIVEGSEDIRPTIIMPPRVKRNSVNQQEHQELDQQQQQLQRSAPTTPGRSSRKSVNIRDDSIEDKEGGEEENNGFVVHRSQLLGRADRDWESPLDLVQSRDQSEEPFSGNASSMSRDSPPGSSMASSLAHIRGHGSHPGRQGVLEEIDSDEFFLRERGISEGEDEDEVNRFLAEELRQAFRPTRTNALDGFDLPTPPAKPGRSPRKPPRTSRGGDRDNNNRDDQDNDNGANAVRSYSSNFQTFPPERPKRKRTPGYVSSYMHENPITDDADAEAEEGGYEGDDNQNEDERYLREDVPEDGEDVEESFDAEDEGIRRVKAELSKIDKDLNDDDSRYEPVNDQDVQPVKPDRRRRKKPQQKPASPPQTLYYNTIAANEWIRDLESEIEQNSVENTRLQLNLVDDTTPVSRQGAPQAPRRLKSKSSSSLAPEVDSDSLHFVDDDSVLEGQGAGQRPVPRPGQQSSQFDGHYVPPLAPGESEARLDDGEDLEIDDSLDYVDEAGYAIVHKDPRVDQPKTFPRKKNRRGENGNGSGPPSKGSSLKRRSKDGRLSTYNNIQQQSGQMGPVGGSATGSSQGQNGSGPFFSLPRYTPRTYHIVPPTRPHRTYSVLRPKRPPRNKSKSKSSLNIDGPSQTQSQNQGQSQGQSPSQSTSRNGSALAIGGPSSSPLTNARRPLTPSSPLLGLRRDEPDRPSTAIGIMQGRPLPPPPRPDRAPNSVPLNDLDQASIERIVNMRHYINYEEEGPEPGAPEACEEPCTARNIPLLTPNESSLGGGAGGGEYTNADIINQETNNIASSLATSDINVAVQTDPVQDDEYELNIAIDSFEEEEPAERIEKRSSASRLPSDEQEQKEEEQQIPPPIPQRPPSLPRPPLEAPQIVFPTRLHLDELEVDVLRVNDLTANILTLQQIRAPHIDLNSISSRGPLSVPSLQTSNITVEQIDCNRLSTNSTVHSDESEMTSVPPPSFYKLSSPLQSSESRETEEDCCDPSGVTDLNRSSECVEDCQCPENTSDACAVEESSQQLASPPPEGSTTVSETAVATRSRVASLPVQSSQVSQVSHITDPDIEDIATSSMRLGRALVRVTVRSLHAMAEFVETAASSDPACQDQQRAHMQILLCLLLVLVAGIILLGRPGAIEPRWQYFLPPHDM